jgi:hypothetical protein
MDLIQLFKTPAMSAIIAGIIAVFSAPLTQRLNRRATEIQWLRERNGQAYSELLTSLDRLANVLMRVSVNPSAENKQDFKTAGEQFTRARSVAALYVPASVDTFLSEVDFVSMTNAPTGDWTSTVQSLAAVRVHIVQCARKDLGSEGGKS